MKNLNIENIIIERVSDMWETHPQWEGKCPERRITVLYKFKEPVGDEGYLGGNMFLPFCASEEEYKDLIIKEFEGSLNPEPEDVAASYGEWIEKNLLANIYRTKAKK